MKVIARNEPEPALVQIVVGPVEVGVPRRVVLVEIREVAVAVRVRPLGTNVSGIVHATIP
jgi:hypothetical protein